MDPVEILYIMEKNAILAAVLSMAILIGWQYIVVKPMENEQVQKQKVAKARAAAQNKGRSSAASAPLKRRLPASSRRALPPLLPRPRRPPRGDSFG